MRIKQPPSKLLIGAFLLLLLARPALACLTIAPPVPAAAHECCEKSCQHQHLQKEMERCCRHQHDSTAQPLAPFLGKGHKAVFAGATMLAQGLVAALSAPTTTSRFVSQTDLGRMHAPPPLYVLHLTLLI